VLKSKLKPNENILFLKYRDLLMNRKENIKTICRFLNEEYKDVYMNQSQLLGRSTASNSKFYQNKKGSGASRFELSSKEKGG